MHSRWVIVSIVGLLMLFSLPFVISLVATAQTEPDVNLSLTENTIEADVQPGQQGTVTCTGFAKCEPTGTEQDQMSISVTLNVIVARDFPFSVNPNQLILNPDSNPSEEFSVTFTIPTSVNANENYFFTVSGIAKNIPGAKSYNIRPVNGNITIKPFMRFSVSSPEGRIVELFPGKDRSIPIEIRNSGNYDESFKIRIADTNIPNIDDWELGLTQSELGVQMNSGSSFFVYMSVPDDAKKGAYYIDFEVTPNARNGTVDVKSSGTTLSISVESKVHSDPEFRFCSFVSAIILIPIIIVVALYIKYRRIKARKPPPIF